MTAPVVSRSLAIWGIDGMNVPDTNTRWSLINREAES